MPRMDTKFGKAKPVCLTIPVDLLQKLDELVTAGESETLIMSGSGVQVPPGPQAILVGEMIYLADVRVGVRVL